MRKLLKKILLWMLDKTQQGSKEPFGAYFTTGIGMDGQAPIQFMWNKAFIQNINQFGYHCATEEETIELFYVATRPTAITEEIEANAKEGIHSENHPQLTDDGNVLKQ